MRILTSEQILPRNTGLACHASSVLPLTDGSVYCVCFYGTAESHDDVRIIGTRRCPDGSWTAPEYLSDDDGQPHWNPVLFRRRDGAVLLFYKVGRPIAEWKTFCRISLDDCRSFGASFELVPGDTSGGRGPVRNHPIYLRDGSILAPASTEQGTWRCFFDRSTDGGKTWVRSNEVTIPGLAPTPEKPQRGIIQPTLWQTDTGVHALMRASEGVLYRADSPDGITWSDATPTSMPNNNSGIDLTPLPDGRLLLVCNPTGTDWGKRSPISLYTSSDNGHSFSLLSHLTTQPGEFSYPSVLADGNLVHLTYTWDRVNIQYFCLSDL